MHTCRIFACCAAALEGMFCCLLTAFFAVMFAIITLPLNVNCKIQEYRKIKYIFFWRNDILFRVILAHEMALYYWTILLLKEIPLLFTLFFYTPQNFCLMFWGRKSEFMTLKIGVSPSCACSLTLFYLLNVVEAK